MKLLFVCSGNICRSPMAAALLRHELERAGRGADVVILSGGTLGLEGYPAAPEAVLALGELGIDLTGHRSRGLDAATVTSADVVVGMSRQHLLELADAFPVEGQERWLLRDFESRNDPHDSRAEDLADPIGRTLDVYRRQCEIMRPCVKHLADYLLRGR